MSGMELKIGNFDVMIGSPEPDKLVISFKQFGISYEQMVEGVIVSIAFNGRIVLGVTAAGDEIGAKILRQEKNSFAVELASSAPK